MKVMLARAPGKRPLAGPLGAAGPVARTLQAAGVRIERTKKRKYWMKLTAMHSAVTSPSAAT
jgi:hypothetical protein